MELEFINTLTESRAFKSGVQFDKLQVQDATGFLYLQLLLHYLYARHSNTDAWNRKYIRRTRAFRNYDYFRQSATDLYMLAYLLLGNHKEYRYYDVLKQRVRINESNFNAFLDRLAIGDVGETAARSYFYALERELRIHTGTYTTYRRNIMVWDSISDEKKKQIVHGIKDDIKRYFYAAEILDPIQKVERNYE